eukprot:jgi/Botrbrau1/20690/Bobra.0058s0020.1
MPQYNFKSIKVVPSSKDFIDIVLSKTQRQTPTVVHNGWAIARIRQFYMRKVKFTAENWHEKLSTILEDFPKLEDIHPFYRDLLNVLYDRDHYKLALGHLSMARNLIGRISQDYVRLLKYGDSLYRCKELKRAALGRMCTVMKKQGPSLAYLEQVRQHMGRLPSIDPNTRTLLLCGFPNVGKSSFMNKVSRADVDVQPYAFTTRSLFLGHLDYKNLRWQIIDTPGLLDRLIEERNTIEMQTITALAHLRAAVLFLVDVSEQCGYTIKKQANLFHETKELFANKPLLIVANKTDVTPLEALNPEDRAILDEMVREAARLSSLGPLGGDTEGKLHTMSTLTEEGVQQVKKVACETLLNARVELKIQGNRVQAHLNKLAPVIPKMRDNVERPPNIPASVLAARARGPPAQPRKTEKDLQEENGGAGVYSADMRKHYMLQDDDWKYDIMPEIMNGHNVLDFVDPDIEARLEALEREEEEAAHSFALDMMGVEDTELTPEEKAQLKAIRHRKKIIVATHRVKKSTAGRRPVLPRRADRERTSTISNFREALERKGVDASAAVDRARARSLSRVGRKRLRSESRGAGDAMDIDAPPQAGASQKRIHSSKSRGLSRGRSQSMKPPGEGKGLKDVVQANKAIKMADRAQRRSGKMARRGEGDRHIPNLKPKHLFSGKRGKGKTDRR